MLIKICFKFPNQGKSLDYYTPTYEVLSLKEKEKIIITLTLANSSCVSAVSGAWENLQKSP
jgi:hypothetical protein